MGHKDNWDNKPPKRAPLWKWIVIIFIVIAMPLFFSYYRMASVQQIFKSSPAPQATPTKPTS